MTNVQSASLGRRIVLLPLIRLLISLGLFGVVMIGLTLLLGAIGLLAVPYVFSLALAVVPLAVIAFVGKVIEQRSLAQVGLSGRGVIRETLLGFALGFGLLATVIGVMALAGWYRADSFSWSAPAIGVALWQFLLVAVFEEAVFRGIIFRILEQGLGSWLALILSALIFGLIHLGNPNASLVAGLAIALEAGILLGAAYMLTRSLWLAIGVHWSWNFTQGPIFGAAVSGTNTTSNLISSTTNGPELWTGGAFGPEAGLVAMIVCTAAGLALLVPVVRRGGIITPQWMRKLRGKVQPAVEAPT